MASLKDANEKSVEGHGETSTFVGSGADTGADVGAYTLTTWDVFAITAGVTPDEFAITAGDEDDTPTGGIWGVFDGGI
jgi:hypothetical protein